MNKLTVTVRINDQDINIAYSNDFSIFSHCFEPLKTTDDRWMAAANGDHLAGSAAAEHVVEMRKDAADHIAKHIADILLTTMQQYDTYNGYRVVKDND